MHAFYQIGSDIKVDRTALEPYEVHISIRYLNDEFREKIQNIVERNKPAFQIKRKNLLRRILQKDNLNIELVSYVHKERMFHLTGEAEYLVGLYLFDFKCGSFSFLERFEAEEALSKLTEIIHQDLDNEAIRFQKIQ
ncbi:hypothetical protein P4U05_18410 [Bacillus paranthracis]|uniref:hypothetical protein n=1 Tax=Bacillus cereus group TaxID=86661 RepID=UPI000200F52B|nr:MULTISPECIES: hypothetical protein [Bacillus cereus group]ADY24934.1 hypothetical protein YBT020_28901 [Bacillus thuringiensis serovar finitimus YBT-020]MRC74519.1 hypothetical protein [Bacillus thuringiensis]OTX77255.1 hypothetical protein BK722_02315 [Bacillus thuringiensis serovar finitimus]MEC3360854.1 hypothetical protein [Bacillus paranthracis]MED0786437.1 hypothetical protein [Bacillus paranthracis]